MSPQDILEKDLKTIVAAGGSTLAETYSKLTLDHADNTLPNFKKALRPFVSRGQLPKVGKPWDSQEPVKQQKQEEWERQQERLRKIIGGLGQVHLTQTS